MCGINPGQVEAAVAMQYLIKCQENAEEFIKPHVKPIIQGEDYNVQCICAEVLCVCICIARRSDL